jgi:predicted nuclease with TOPRIM domain
LWIKIRIKNFFTMERGGTMGIQKQIVSLLGVLLVGLALAGCSAKSHGDLAAAKAEAAKAQAETVALKKEVQTAKEAVSKLQTEKDALAAQVKTMTGELEKFKTDLAAAVKERSGLQEQIKKFTGDASGAAAQTKIIDELKAQLAALTTKYTSLQGENGKLQSTIKDLQDKIKAAGSNLIPKLP